MSGNASSLFNTLVNAGILAAYISLDLLPLFCFVPDRLEAGIFFSLFVGNLSEKSVLF